LAVTASQLLTELVRLRRGWATQAALHVRLGAKLKELCDITDDDDQARSRDKLAMHLTRVASRLPPQVELIALVGLCLHPDARLRRLEDREDWLMERLGVSKRTVVRRLDEALELLAQELVRDRELSKSIQDPYERWYAESFTALVRIDADSPEVIEERLVVALVDDVATLRTSLSVPRHPRDNRDTHRLDAELLYGGLLVLQEQPSESRFYHVIELPKPLQAGEKHRYSIRFRIPADQLMAPHYVYTPKHRTDYFEVRVRFGADNPHATIWKLDSVATAVIYERKPVGEVIRPDRFGEVYAEFRNLKVGYGYGVRWNDDLKL